ncbi:hypothetical protein [Niveispirillum sp. BGYR6]|uniref:protein-tyrosine phosphatase family protein n=1 Tax=Niveispirillum sp. BGYR6 TaxID=2971249 RepID=UPI0022B95C61|nr:hypothetical protein [Niveispirillum sp. BGYR6]MDG5496955.1 hypothetical protein [Niveispirillum sp. BGYR6]
MSHRISPSPYRPQPRGSLPFTLGGYSYEVTGGPYRGIPDGFVGVKMAAEIDMPCTVDIPICDYGTPTATDLRRGLVSAINCIIDGKPVYVGCMAGIGRTGLFLAALAKVAGEADPVAYVRRYYYPGAVETRAQHDFVQTLPVGDIQQALARALWLRRWFGWCPLISKRLVVAGL